MQTTNKNVSVKTTEASPAPTPDLRAAYQAHTLVQMLYGQMALGQSWPVQSYPYTGPLPGYASSPLQATTPWTGDERYGVGWMYPRWH
jgi:hypothetical protein